MSGGGCLLFILRCIAGAVPWLAILVYTIAPGSDAEPPGFVYAIVVSLFLFFNVFALNRWLQYRARGGAPTTWSVSGVTSSSAWWRSRCWPWQVFGAPSRPSSGDGCPVRR